LIFEYSNRYSDFFFKSEYRIFGRFNIRIYSNIRIFEYLIPSLALGHNPAKVPKFKYKALWYSIDRKFTFTWYSIDRKFTYCSKQVKIEIHYLGFLRHLEKRPFENCVGFENLFYTTGFKTEKLKIDFSAICNNSAFLNFENWQGTIFFKIDWTIISQSFRSFGWCEKLFPAAILNIFAILFLKKKTVQGIFSYFTSIGIGISH
jgi:hypothetical protein